MQGKGNQKSNDLIDFACSDRSILLTTHDTMTNSDQAVVSMKRSFGHNTSLIFGGHMRPTQYNRTVSKAVDQEAVLTFLWSCCLAASCSCASSSLLQGASSALASRFSPGLKKFLQRSMQSVPERVPP